MKPSESQRFHDSLRAAVVAGVPLRMGPKNRQLDLHSLDRWQEALASHSGQTGSSGPVALKWGFDSNPGLPVGYRAALKVFLQTQSMSTVLDGLTVRRSAESKAMRSMRWAFIYLFLLLTVAYVGLSLFNNQVIPVVDEMRADLLLPAAIHAPARFDVTPWMPWATTILGWSLVLILVGAALGGARWLLGRLGGQRYVHDCIAATTLRILQILVESGMPVDEATQVSCELTGAERLVQSELKTVAEFPDQFESLASYLAISAERRLEHLRFATPIGLVCTVGGGVALLYCLAIFWPILSLLKDLATAGI